MAPKCILSLSKGSAHPELGSAHPELVEGRQCLRNERPASVRILRQAQDERENALALILRQAQDERENALALILRQAQDERELRMSGNSG